MARYKFYDYDQTHLIAVSLEEQLLEGSLEHAIHVLVENKMDLSIFDCRYNNDETGCKAYDPKILLKVVLFAYSRGFVGSRRIEWLCRKHVTCMALACMQSPDHSTLAAFVSSMHPEILSLFRDILLVCEQQQLLGGTVFALDGLKLSSNASKQWSGTLEELKHKQEKLEAKIQQLLSEHQQTDAEEEESASAPETSLSGEGVPEVIEFESPSCKSSARDDGRCADLAPDAQRTPEPQTGKAVNAEAPSDEQEEASNDEIRTSAEIKAQLHDAQAGSEEAKRGKAKGKHCAGKGRKTRKQKGRMHPKKQRKSKKQKRVERLKRLRRHAARLKDWLASNDKKIGRQGKEIKSNITDNESAKMATSHGVIQGYNAQAIVDGSHQVIVAAEVFGDGQDGQHLNNSERNENKAATSMKLMR